MTAVARVDSSLLGDIRRFGAADVSACFSCGVCTATCPLVTNDGTFPRRIIRYAELGLRDKLLSSKELWTCYACGQCSDSCPTQAEPSEFMAAARRYAVASYDRTRLARVLSTSPLLATLLTVLLAVLLAGFMYTAHGPMATGSLDLFGFVPAELIHDLGLAAMAVVVVAGLLGVATMVRGVSRAEGETWRSVAGSRGAVRRSAGALWQALVVETLGQRRYRAECEVPPVDRAAAADELERPWYRRRWFLHAAAMWGFLGLLAATILDYGLAIVGIKATGSAVPIWYPIRLLGTLAGLLLMYGTTMLIVRRRRGEERALRRSTTGDWTFLSLLWLAGLTGFAIELALYLPSVPAWGYWLFLFHVAVAMELVLLVPFTKFAHAIYRPIALFFLALAPSRMRTEAGGVG
jgi:heterodisulfide reductase subunit C